MMIGNKRITAIIMERGLEDMQIIDEINKVHSMLGIGPRDFHFNFPKLSQLRQELENEYDKSNCDQ